MSKLTFEILPSEESNDHQVRILVDDRDFLGEQHLGIDPPEFFEQFGAQKDYLLIGRCTCGCVGCGDYHVSVRKTDDIAEWIVGDVAVAQFERAGYEQSIRHAAEDHSWEPQGRRIERLVGTELQGAVVTDELKFEWASTRCKPGALTLHFAKDAGLPTYAYRLIDISWDGKSDESAVRAARHYRLEHCV